LPQTGSGEGKGGDRKGKENEVRGGKGEKGVGETLTLDKILDTPLSYIV